MNKEDRKEVDLIEYWKVIVKRKWVLISFAAALVIFTGVFSFLATPIYKSKTTLLIEDEASKMLSIDETFSYQPQFTRDLRFFNTQLMLLKSNSLAERIARKMNLLSRPEFGAGQEQKQSIMSSAKNILTLKWLAPKKRPLAEQTRTKSRSNPYSDVAKRILNRIEVKPVRDTKLVDVSFVSSSPTLAAEVANTLAEEFISFSVEKRYETTQQASNFLSEQISSLQEDLAAKEQELQKYGQEKDLFFLSNTESTAVNKLAEINSAFTQATLDRIKSEATYRELKDLSIDSLPPVVNDPVIQQLKTDYARLKNDYDEKSKIFKPDYPEMIQLKARLDSIANQLKKAADAAESEYRSALNREGSLANLLETQRKEVAKMNKNAIFYNSLKIEVENKRRLLNSLGERQNETLVSARLAGLKTSNINIIDKAEVPERPISPKKRLNLILALLFGLLGGIALCFLLEILDNTVKGPEDVEKLVGLPSLGVIPFLSPDGLKESRKDNYYVDYQFSSSIEKENVPGEEELSEIKDIDLINLRYPRLSISEDYRTARTSILLSQAENPPKTILFTSCMPQEGKTSTVANMAISFSQLHERVLIIEADLRRPRLHKIFKVRNVKGLSGYLTGKAGLKDAIQMTSVENVWLLPCGPIPPNPVELINSKKMRNMIEAVREVFDVVLIDSPPLLAVVDTVIISSFVDGTVIVIHVGKTTRKPFLNAVAKLRQARAKIMGVVFNKLSVEKRNYQYMDYYHYYPPSSYGTEGQEAEGEKKVAV